MSWIRDFFVILLISFFFIFLLEFFTRFLSDINFLGNSKNLFLKYDDGSYGNSKSVKGKSFGIDVYTDQNGYRVKGKGYLNRDLHSKNQVVIIGDSVGFGSGVIFENTFQGLLEKSFKEHSFTNLSVIGYDTFDYMLATDRFFNNNKNKIKAAFLIFCLNDITSKTSEDIRNNLFERNPTEKLKNTNFFTSFNSFEKLKKIKFFTSSNSFLRDKSKFYLFLKNNIIDTQKLTWQSHKKNYEIQSKENIYDKLKPINKIYKKFKNKKIPLKIIILPYEFQTRKNQTQENLPQKILTEYFLAHGLTFIDAHEIFVKESNPETMFLKYDSMHLSEKGHKILYKIISGFL